MYNSAWYANKMDFPILFITDIGKTIKLCSFACSSR